MSRPARTHRIPWWSGWPAAAILLAAHLGLGLGASTRQTVTFDEIFHIPAGIAYWTENRYDVDACSGNIPQRWGTLPLVAAGHRLPRPGAVLGAAPATERAGPLAADGPVAELGKELLFGRPGQAEKVLFRAHASMALLSVAAGALVYGWSRRLFGAAGGMISLALFAFCPNFLAHGPLVTSDTASALFFLAAVGATWRLLHRVSPGTILAAGSAVGALFLSKMSAPLWAPAAALLLGLRLWRNRPLPVALGALRWEAASRRGQAAWLAAGLTAAAAIAWGLVWAAFGFRFAALETVDAAGLGLPSWGWVLQGGSGWLSAMAVAARDCRLLPEAYLHGLAFSFKTASARNAFLNGEFAHQGWPGFFPYAVLVKTPLWTFGILCLAGGAAVARWFAPGGRLRGTWALRLRRALYRTAPLTVFLAIYWATAITSHINIGLRHMLPACAAAYVLAGAAGSRLRWAGRRAPRWCAIGLLAGLAVESTLTWPHYLAYFNPIAGGPRSGYRHLVDSSLDWGQDLPELSRWLEKERRRRALDGMPPEPVYLSYFGNGEPAYYGIQATSLPGFSLPERRNPEPAPRLLPGLYCVSATILQGVFFPGGPAWTDEKDDLYRRLRPLVTHYETISGDDAARRIFIGEIGAGNRPGALTAFGNLRMERLCAYLRTRAPDAMPGYSILVYRLTAEELEAAESPPRDRLLPDQRGAPPGGAPRSRNAAPSFAFASAVTPGSAPASAAASR